MGSCSSATINMSSTRRRSRRGNRACVQRRPRTSRPVLSRVHCLVLRHAEQLHRCGGAFRRAFSLPAPRSRSPRNPGDRLGVLLGRWLGPRKGRAGQKESGTKMGSHGGSLQRVRGTPEPIIVRERLGAASQKLPYPPSRPRREYQPVWRVTKPACSGAISSGSSPIRVAASSRDCSKSASSPGSRANCSRANPDCRHRSLRLAPADGGLLRRSQIGGAHHGIEPGLAVPVAGSATNTQVKQPHRGSPDPEVGATVPVQSGRRPR